MIGHILKLMLTRGTKIKRWNNFPRVEYISFLDNIGFVMHIALFLSSLEEENGTTIDTVYIIKKIMFESLKGLMLSDINAGTRDYIVALDANLYKKVEDEAIQKILGGSGIDEISADIFSVLNTEKKTEDTLIQAARKYSAWCECRVNARVYDEIFDLPLQKIQTQLQILSSEVFSLKKLLENNDFQKYLSHIRRLSHSIRWSGENRLVPISVMAHLVIVTMITYFIALIESKEGHSYDIKKMLFTALYHDIPEAITGDIISPVKNSVPGFADIIEQAEKNMLDDYLFCFVGDEYKKNISPFMFHPFETKEGKMVKHADILSALYEAKIEIFFGNTKDYEDICHKIESKLNQYDLKSIHYLLKNGLLEFNEKNMVQ